MTDLTQFLKTNSPLLQQLIDALPMPIFYKNTDGIYLGCNKYFAEFIQLPQEDIVGSSPLELFEHSLATLYLEADQKLFAQGGIQVYESEIKRVGADNYYVKFHKTCFYDEQGNVAGLIGAIFNITEQKNLELSLQKLANYDSLTGLYNRREGLLQGEKLYQNWQRYGDVFCLLMIDIDYFKQINDTHGHDVGDRALCHIAEMFSHHARSNDIVMRYGGEEFAIWLPSTHLNQGRQVAERYRKNIEKSAFFVDNEIKLTITVSIGLAMGEGQTITELFKQADQALYRAKRQGRNRVEV